MPWKTNALTKLLGIAVPIIQAAALSKSLPAAELMNTLVTETSGALGKLAGT